MKALFLLGALALTPATASTPRPAPTLAEDFADVTSRTCYPVMAGQLRWDPSKLEEERVALGKLGLTPGIPGGVIDALPPTLAATFNQAILASRRNGQAHVLFALGRQTLGCQVIAVGAPGTVTEAQMVDLLGSSAHGWTRAPALDRLSGLIQSRGFVRRTGNGRTLLLDLVVMKEPVGTFRLMTMVMSPPPGAKLPEGF
ncbi:MAG TPA: hypothetical protein VGA98_09390 [Allosphingosinicella sp.]